MTYAVNGLRQTIAGGFDSRHGGGDRGCSADCWWRPWPPVRGRRARPAVHDGEVEPADRRSSSARHRERSGADEHHQQEDEAVQHRTFAAVVDGPEALRGSASGSRRPPSCRRRGTRPLLVARPTVSSRPRTISRTPAHHAGQAPNATGDPLGKANSFAVPCIANISPTMIRKMQARRHRSSTPSGCRLSGCRAGGGGGHEVRPFR